MVTAPTAVYRLFDREGRLLYVGASSSLGTRWGQHARRDWWPEVFTYTLSWHEFRAAALAEEARAIRDENPLHNIAGTAFDWESLTEDELRALPDYIPPTGPPKPRRRKGDGGLFQRADGYWVACLDLGYRPNGLRWRKTFTSRDRDAALAKMRAFEQERAA